MRILSHVRICIGLTALACAGSMGCQERPGTSVPHPQNREAAIQTARDLIQACRARDMDAIRACTYARTYRKSYEAQLQRLILLLANRVIDYKSTRALSADPKYAAQRKETLVFLTEGYVLTLVYRRSRWIAERVGRVNTRWPRQTFGHPIEPLWTLRGRVR
jgi:hypothetical protein